MATPTLLLAIAAITTSPQITAAQVPIQHTADGGGAPAMRAPPIGEAVALLVVVSGCEIPTDVPMPLDRTVVILEEADGAPTAVIAPIADTYIRRGRPNRNQGSVELLRVRSSENNRALIQFDQGAIEEAVGSGMLEGATLELTITHSGNHWRRRGRRVAVHRMTQGWTELGATWNCANDVDTSNRRRDCEGSGWRMGRKHRHQRRPFVRSRTATTRIKSAQTGVVSFDVTRDVEAFLAGQDANFGWLIKKKSERGRGRIEFGSRESTSPPRLLLVVEGGGGQDQIARGSVPNEGGTVSLEGIGSITFPAGAFAETQSVELDGPASEAQGRSFDEVAGAGSAGAIARTEYVVRVLTDAVPATAVEVRLNVPEQLVAMLTPTLRLRLYARLYGEGTGAVIDHYEAVDLTSQQFDPQTGELTATLPGESFTTNRRQDGRAELLLIIGIQPIPSPGSAPFGTAAAATLSALASQVCALLETIGSSLPGRHVQQDRFQQDPTPEHRRHLGVDYRAGSGTIVLAMRDGVVDFVGIERDSVGNLAGYGHWVQLRHGDGTFTRYAHLTVASADHLGLSASVVQGEVIALSDATGSSASAGQSVDAHLHVEYRDADLRAHDPEPCLDETPFSGVWVGASRTNRQAVNRGRDGEGNEITIFTQPDVPQSRWVLRQTVTIPPLPDQTVDNDTALVGEGTFVVVDGNTIGEITYTLGSGGDGRIARLGVGAMFFSGAARRDVSGLPRFKMEDPPVDPVTASTYPLIPSGTYNETDLEGVIVQDSIATQTVPTGPTAPDTLLAKLSLEYKAPPIPSTVLRIEEFRLTREVPDGFTPMPLVAGAVQRTKPARRRVSEPVLVRAKSDRWPPRE